MTNEERPERLRAMRERLHEPLSNQTGAGATLGIKGRAGIVLAELLDFLASEEPAVVMVEAKLDRAEGISGDGVKVALEEGRAVLRGILRAKGRKITQAEQNDMERWASAAIALIDNALEVGGPAVPARAKQSPRLVPGDIVRLASGGPAMTVVAPAEDLGGQGPVCVVAWMCEATQEVRRAHFPPTALGRVEDEQRAEQERLGHLDLVQAQRRILDRVYAALEQIEPLLAGDLRHEGSRESLAALKYDIFCALAEDV